MIKQIGVARRKWYEICRDALSESRYRGCCSRALKELTQELKAAKSGEEQFEIHQKFYALRDEYNTTIQIAMIRSDVDTADAVLQRRKELLQ